MGEYKFTRREGSETARCDTCHGLVFVGDEEAHGEWHERLREHVGNQAGGIFSTFMGSGLRESI